MKINDLREAYETSSKIIPYILILILVCFALVLAKTKASNIEIATRSSGSFQSREYYLSSEYRDLSRSEISLEFIDETHLQDSVCILTRQYYLVSGQATPMQLLGAVQTVFEKQMEISLSKGLTDSVSRELYLYSSEKRYRQRPSEWLAKVSRTCTNDMTYIYRDDFGDRDSRVTSYRVPVWRKIRTPFNIL